MSFGEISWLAKGATGYAVFSDRPKDLPIPKYATLSSEGEEMGEALPNRRIATRSTELFVAAGCEIRCIDLRDLKARCTEENEGTEGQAGKDTEISRLKLREYQV